MDCTACLDCVHACPKDNIGIIAVPPWRNLTSDALQSGVGKYSQRFDLAVVITLLTFSAFANAAGMVAPVLRWEEEIKIVWGFSSTFPVVTLFYLFTLILLPTIFIWLASTFSIRWGHSQMSKKQVFAQFAVSLAPLGFGMWLAHLLFHLFTGSHTFIPVFQRVISDLGWPVLGTPHWGIRSWAFPGLLKMELLLLDLGFLLSLFVAWKRAAHISLSSTMLRLRTFFPWGILILLLYCIGMWILFQPMDMRGTM
jgi:hypothetical protein